MRCAADYCIYNEDGYCSRASYVGINQEGECDTFTRRPPIDLGLKKKDPEKKYGIWDGCAGRFLPGVRESSPDLAWARLVSQIGDNKKTRWRFEARELPAAVKSKNPQF